MSVDFRRSTTGSTRFGPVLWNGPRSTIVAVHSTRPGRPSVLKLSRAPGGEPRLTREAYVLQGVRHPNVVGCQGLTRLEDGQLALVLDRLPGQPLARLEDLSRRHALEVALGITRGLAAMHLHGFAHGDLCAENVLVERLPDAARVWLVDPGAPTEHGETPPVDAAPEVLSGNAPDRLSDLYALGCLLHRLLLGTPVFADLPDDARVDAHRQLEFTPPSRCPPSLADLLHALLAKAPDARGHVEHALTCLAELMDREPQAELSALASHHLSSAVPCHIVAPDLERVTQGLRALSGGHGAFFTLRGPEASGRTTTITWCHQQAITLGVQVQPIVNLARDLFGAESLEAVLARPHESVTSALRLMDCGTGPRLVYLDAPRLEPGLLQLACDTLRAAARTQPLVALVTRDLAPDAAPNRECVDLRPLDLRTTERLVGAWLEAPAAEQTTVAELSHRVGARTVGQLRWTLREALVRGLLLRRTGAWVVDHTGLDASVEELAAELAGWSHSTVASLPPAQRHLLGALACFDEPVSRETLAGVLDPRSPWTPEALGSLETLVAEGLVLATSDGRFTLAQRSIAEAALRVVGPEETAALHGRAAERPAGTPGPLSMALRVWHSLQAGAPVSASEVAAAATAFEQSGNPARALRVLSLAAPLWVDGIPAMERQALSLATSSALVATGALTTARAVLESAEAQAPHADVTVALASLLVRLGDYGEAARRLAGLETSPRVLVERARAELLAGHAETAELLARQVVGDPDATPALLGHAWHIAATAVWHRGDPERAEHAATEGLRVVGTLDRAVRADLLRCQGAVRVTRGALRSARDVLVQAVAENRTLGRVPELSKALNNLAVALHGLGEWGTAAALWEEYRLLCARQGDPTELCNAHNNLAYLKARIGEVTTAAQLYRLCIEQARSAGYMRIVPVALANLGELLAEQGELAEARRAFDEAEQNLGSLDGELHLVELERRRADVLVREGAFQEALEAVRSALADVSTERPQLERAHLKRLESIALLRLDRPAEAEISARRALELCESQGTRYEAALVQEVLSRALKGQGRVIEAGQYANEALQTFRDLGARSDLERATQLVRSLGRPSQKVPQLARHGQILLDVALSFGSTLDLDQLLPLVLKRVVELLDAERGVLALLDESARIQEAVVHGLPWAGPGHPLPIPERLFEEVAHHGRSVALSEVHELEGAVPGAQPSGRFRAVVALPILGRAHDVLGLLYLDARAHAVEDPRASLDLLTGLTRLLGTALENARMFEEERLRVALIDDLAHDLRTPITVISSNAEMLMGEPGDTFTAPPEQSARLTRESAGDIYASAQRMHRMVEHILELARLRAAAGVNLTHRIDLVRELRRHIQTLEVLARNQSLTLTLAAAEELPLVETVPDRVWIVVDNLVFNALKFAREGSTVLVSMSLRPDRGPTTAQLRTGNELDIFRRLPALVPAEGTQWLELGVRNEGQPVPLDLRDRLFDRYTRGSSTARGHRSTGLGLAIVAQCVRHLGGAVWLDEATDRVTRIAFSLPVSLRPS